jgi:hypothetical protein
VIPLTLTQDVPFGVLTDPVTIPFDQFSTNYTVRPDGSVLVAINSEAGVGGLPGPGGFTVEYTTPLGPLHSGPYGGWSLYLSFDSRNIANARISLESLTGPLGGVFGNGVDPTTGSLLDFSLTPPLPISFGELLSVPEVPRTTLVAVGLVLLAIAHGRPLRAHLE